MASDSDRAQDIHWLLPRSVHRLPADLASIIAIVVLTGIAIFLPSSDPPLFRILFGLPFVLFAPGYAFIAALFPEADSPTGDDDTDAADPDESQHRLTPQQIRDRGSIDGIERVALSFGTSIAIVPLLGLVLNFTPWGIRLLPVFITISGFTLIATAIGAHRRWALPAEARFRVPYKYWLGTARSELFEPDTRADLALNVLLVLSLFVAAASVTYAVAVPQQGESFTEFYALTENETGDLVADEYPTEFRPGESKPLYLGIGNHEHRDMDYSIVVELQRVETTNNTTRVLEADELRRLQASVSDNETWQQELNITPTLEGQRLRLAFLLYQNSPPPQPTVDNAYRELHLWVNVTTAESPSAMESPPDRYTSDGDS